ncbi:MAG: DUF2959 domain-containing protein [Nitrospirales bacterium]
MHLPIAQRILNFGILCLAIIPLIGCQTAYYGAMEKLGYHKRDILVSDVEKARDAQADAKEQFKSALERFSSVLNFKGGDLQEKYDKLNAEYEQSEARANTVHKRVSSVEDVSEALFSEWKAELKEYSNANLRRTSQRKLDQTRQQYAQLIKAMKRAEKKMDPVMAAFKDQVLFLKHNLNAKAIASLKNELIAVKSDISSLIKEMEASIKEADSFISTMAKSQ